MSIPENPNSKGYGQNVPNTSEINERTNYDGVYESVQSGGSKPIDISLMTGQPAPSNSNKNNGDD